MSPVHHCAGPKRNQRVSCVAVVCTGTGCGSTASTAADREVWCGVRSIREKSERMATPLCSLWGAVYGNGSVGRYTPRPSCRTRCAGCAPQACSLLKAKRAGEPSGQFECRITAGGRKRPSCRPHRPTKRGEATGCRLSEAAALGGRFWSILASQVAGMEEEIPQAH